MAYRPISAGRLRDRITFERWTNVPDGGGGSSEGWEPIAGLENIRGAFMPERSRERLEAGRLESAVAGTLRVRSSNASRGVTAADRVKVNGEVFAIFSVTNPDRRNRFLEMSVEKGSAQAS